MSDLYHKCIRFIINNTRNSHLFYIHITEWMFIIQDNEMYFSKLLGVLICTVSLLFGLSIIIALYKHKITTVSRRYVVWLCVFWRGGGGD